MARKKKDTGTEEMFSPAPGVAPIKITALTKAMREYRVARDERVLASQKELPAKAKVLTLMHANEDKLRGDDGVIRYQCDGKIAKIVPKKEGITFEDAEVDDDDQQD